jgi:pantothenate kinase
LVRLQARTDPVVYAPRFDRSLEESIGSAVPVPTEVPLIVTEGNYLQRRGHPGHPAPRQPDRRTGRASAGRP